MVEIKVDKKKFDQQFEDILKKAVGKAYGLDREKEPPKKKEVKLLCNACTWATLPQLTIPPCWQCSSLIIGWG